MKYQLIGYYHPDCLSQPFTGEVVNAPGNTCMRCKSRKFYGKNPVQAYYNVENKEAPKKAVQVS